MAFGITDALYDAEGDDGFLWSKASWPVFILITVFLCAHVFAIVLGRGWAGADLDQRHTAISKIGFFSMSGAIGHHLIRLKKDQLVEVNYKARIKKGCVQIYLSREFAGKMEFSKTAKIIDSSEGILTLRAPDTGWYSMNVFPENTLCFSDKSTRVTGPLFSYDIILDYNMHWRVLG